MTIHQYAQDVQVNLADLCERLHSGRYRPQPVRRVCIPKADGGQRPLGVPTLEDKIVQGAVAEVLSAVYEADFLDSSFGFRPGRSAHQALRTVHTTIMEEGVNWVLDADIRKFFDSVDHEWMLRMLSHRIADPRVLRLIRQWLEAGVMERGIYAQTIEGTPQEAGISPLLSERSDNSGYGNLMIMESKPLRALIFKGLDKDQVPIKICFSPAGIDPGQENQHVFHDHKHGVARSEW